MSMVGEISQIAFPILGISIPIIAIVGGIAARITRTMARARIHELMIQERIRAIEKGVAPLDPLPPLPNDDLFDNYERRSASRTVFGLRLAGSLVGAIAIAVMFSLYQSGAGDGYVWMSLPLAIGVVLFAGSFFVPGRNEPDSVPGRAGAPKNPGSTGIAGGTGGNGFGS